MIVGTVAMLTVGLNAGKLPDTYKLTEKEEIKLQSKFKKVFRKKCGFTASNLAQQHTQTEWREIHEKGEFKKEFAELCPSGASVMNKSEVFSEKLFKYTVKYASDSKQFPRC